MVPVLDDADQLARLLATQSRHPFVEMLVVDGGYDARLDHLAGPRPDVRVIRAPRGRASQMNAGAACALGDWLLFLHADCRLPPGWVEALLAAPAEATGGWFRFALDSRAWQARVIERGVAWRVRWLRLPYGDQGLFVRREVFIRLGGYPLQPLMEDVAFAHRLVREGPVWELDLALVTSARRWERDGWWRRSARNLVLVTFYALGVAPDWLARAYEGARRTRP